MFLGWRREMVRLGEAPLKSHRRLLYYEQLGGSPLFRLLHLPPGCTSVFFPGCALPGIRPEQTLELYRRLQAIEPTMGIMLDCCNQPSHDLGRQQFFQERFRKRLARLTAANIRTILTACPSCHRALTAFSHDCTVTSAYTMLASHGIAAAAAGNESTPFAIHDPCSTRSMPEMQTDIRTLCSHRGLTLVEMAHSRSTTFCCGEGGAAGHMDNTPGSSWNTKRWMEAGDTPLITYCAGCTSRLGQQARVHHLVDLLFTENLPESPAQPQVSSLRRWLNRLSLKLRLMLQGP